MRFDRERTFSKVLFSSENMPSENGPDIEVAMIKCYEFKLRPHPLVLLILVLMLPALGAAQSLSGEEDLSPARVKSVIQNLRAKRIDPARVNDARKTGFDLLRFARYEEAWRLFSAALVVAPDDARLMYGGALALFNQQRIPEAERLARAAVTASSKASERLPKNSGLDMETADALVLLGVVLAVKGDNASALEVVGQAAIIAPANFDAQFALGRARYGAGNLTGAAAAFRAALALRPNDEKARFFLATALEGAADYDGALAVYRHLLQLHPGSADGHLGLGVLLIKLGNAKTEDGIAELKRAVALNGNLYEAQIALGRGLIRVGRATEAIDYLLRATVLAPNNPEPHFQLAIAYRRTGRVSEANEQTTIVQKIHATRRTRDVTNTGGSDVRPD